MPDESGNYNLECVSPVIVRDAMLGNKIEALQKEIRNLSKKHDPTYHSRN